MKKEEPVVEEKVYTSCCCCGEKTLLQDEEEAYPLCNSCKYELFPACTCERYLELPDLNLLRAKRDKSPLFAVWFYHIGNMMISRYELSKDQEDSLREELQEICRIYGMETIYRLLYHLGIHMFHHGCIMDAYQCFNRSFRGAWKLCEVKHYNPAEVEELLAKSAYMMAETCGEESLYDWNYAVAFAEANFVQAEQNLRVAVLNAGTTKRSQRKQVLWLSEQYSKIADRMSFNTSLERRTRNKAKYLKNIAEEGIRGSNADDQLGLEKNRSPLIRKPSSDKMVIEALRRIKKLEEEFDLRPSIYEHFEEGELYYSYEEYSEVVGENSIKCIDNINHDERYVKAVEEFQDKYGYLVYHVIEWRDDNIITLLYVSNREEEWSLERLDSFDNSLPVYVHNFNYPHLSFFKKIYLGSAGEGTLGRLN